MTSEVNMDFFGFKIDVGSFNFEKVFANVAKLYNRFKNGMALHAI